MLAANPGEPALTATFFVETLFDIWSSSTYPSFSNLQMLGGSHFRGQWHSCSCANEFGRAFKTRKSGITVKVVQCVVAVNSWPILGKTANFGPALASGNAVASTDTCVSQADFQRRVYDDGSLRRECKLGAAS